MGTLASHNVNKIQKDSLSDCTDIIEERTLSNKA